MKNIIIIGARGFKYNYGGWETFVTNLVENYNDKNVCFHIPELTHDRKMNKKIINKDKVKCLQIYVPKIGFVTMFLYAIKALIYMKKYFKEQSITNSIIYILGCRVGPFYKYLVNPLKKRGARIYLNPDGLEWMRDKWAWWIKECFKISEACMVKNSDYIICDSKAILEYIKNKYQGYQKKVFYISYGAYLNVNIRKTDIVNKLFKKYKLDEYNYYLVVGRFVPENNYELIISEFMKSNTKKDLVIISNVKEDKFYKTLLSKTKFDTDKRVKIIGPMYDKESLDYIRSRAYSYIHGHSAGGTNPSLLESLALTNLNILFNAIYNVEVGMTSSLYFSKKSNDLKRLIEKCDNFNKKDIKKYGDLAKKQIKDYYTWDKVIKEYKKIW